MKKMYITGSLKNSLSNVIENLCNTLSSPLAVYRVQDTEVVFNSSSLVGLPNGAVCSRLLDLTTSDEDEFVSGKQKHSKSYKQVRVVQVVTFFFISNINWTKTKPIRPAKNYTSFKWSSNEWKQGFHFIEYCSLLSFVGWDINLLNVAHVVQARSINTVKTSEFIVLIQFLFMFSFYFGHLENFAVWSASEYIYCWWQWRGNSVCPHHTTQFRYSFI